MTKLDSLPRTAPSFRHASRTWKALGLALFATLAAGAASAQSVTLDFDGLVDPGEDRQVSSYSSQGFTLTAPQGDLYVYSNTYDEPSAPPDDSDFLGNENSGMQEIVLVGMGAFDLVSVEAACLFSGADGLLTVTGHLAAGGQVTETFVLPAPAGVPGTATWNTCSLPPTFTNLSSVSFAANNSIALGLDDIALLGGPTAVPALPPLGLGALILLVAVAGRRQLAR